MSDITDDIALGGSFGNVGEDQVQTIPTNPVGPEPTELRTVTNDSSLGSAFGQNGSPEAITATSEAAQSAIQAAISEENALASATASASSATASAASATESASSASTSSSEASAAAASAAAALVSENNAEDSETNASASETSAATDAASATASATSATASATSASTSAIAAAASETSAASSATSSQTSATNAATSETNAATSETNAATAETNAGVSATAAATSATVAATSATSAATSASSATASANSATTQAEIAFNNAATSAYEASLSAASATAAATSEANASTSATTASTAATNSATSATNSATSATNSATSATNAATSETNAATSATNAALSATSAETAETNAEAAESNAATSAATATTKASEAVTSASSASTSASTATTKASEAATSATNAATSESNASSSATAAAASETNAATSETNAATSATNAATSASSASTSATNAGTSATAAATSETNASSSELAASGSATDAANSATASAASATASATSATNSAGSAAASLTAQSASEAARDAALAAFDSFDDRYLGQKTADPTTDNDGEALVAGTLYFNTTSDIMKVYEGTQWVAAYASLSGALIATYNLSDLTDTNAARTNLGLGTIATADAEDYLLSTGGIVTGTIEAPLFEGDLSGAQLFPAKAGEAITKGDALYISGISGNTPIVMKANASDFTKMPSFGVSQTTVSTNASVNCVTYGQLHNIDTTPFSLGDQLYVSTTSGELTATAPAGETSLIQNLGKVERVHASTGALFIAGAGRANATPNLDSGNFFLGNGSNQAVSADFDTSVTNIALPLAGGALTGAVTTTSTFDGRDVSVDGAKLDGIEANATADQTALEIKTAYESNANTNAFTDADESKLDGIEALATADQTAAEIRALVEAATDSNVFTDADHTKLDGIAANANNYVLPFTDNSTNWNTAYSWGDHASAGYYPASNPNGYTNDQTASEILTAIKTVDGSGSGLDADLLDGQQGSYYAAASSLSNYLPLTGGNLSGNLKVVNADAQIILSDETGSPADQSIRLRHEPINANNPNSVPNALWLEDASATQVDPCTLVVEAEIYANGSNKVWHTGNDGSGSGLDADLLDGQQGSYYYPASNPNGYTTNTGTVIEGGTTFNGTYPLTVRVSANNIYSHPNIQFTGSSSTLTISGNPVWHTGNDGSGSGLDADLLDGVQASSFLRSDADDTLTGNLQINSHVINMDLNNVNDNAIEQREVRSSTWPYVFVTNSVGNDNQSGFWVGSNGYPDMRLRRENSTVRALISSWETSYVSNGFNINGNTAWHAGNDGSGSGLDADLLDGLHESTFMRRTANSSLNMVNNNITNVNNLTFNDPGVNEGIQWLGGNDWRIFESSDALANSAGNLQFTTGGTRRMTINTSGSAWTSSQGTLWGSSNDGSGSGLDADTVDGIQGSSFLRSDTSDTASGSITFSAGTIYMAGNLAHSGDTNTYMGFHAADQWRVVTAGVERLEVNNSAVTVSGNMVVSGTLSVRAAIDLADSDILRFGSSDDVEFFCNGAHMYTDLNSGIGNWYIRDTTTTRFTFDDAGHFTATGNITAYSDIRLKEDIKPIEDAVSKVQQLTGNTYTRNDLKDPDRRYGGVIAQEVEVVLPEAVNDSEDGTKTVDYNAMIALLVESVKELKAEVDYLKTQMENK